MRQEFVINKYATENSNSFKRDCTPTIIQSEMQSLENEESSDFDIILPNLMKKQKSSESQIKGEVSDEKLVQKLKSEILQLQMHELENESKKIEIDDMKRVIRSLLKTLGNNQYLDVEVAKELILENHTFRKVYESTNKTQVLRQHSPSLLSVILKQLYTKLESIIEIEVPFCKQVYSKIHSFKSTISNIGVWDVSSLPHDTLLQIHRLFLDGLEDFREHFQCLITELKRMQQSEHSRNYINLKKLNPEAMHLTAMNYSNTMIGESDAEKLKKSPVLKKSAVIEESEILKCLDEQQSSNFFEKSNPREFSKKLNKEIYIKIDKVSKSGKQSNTETNNNSLTFKRIEPTRNQSTKESKNESVTFQIEGDHPDYDSKKQKQEDGDSLSFKTKNGQMNFFTKRSNDDIECSYFVSDVQDSQLEILKGEILRTENSPMRNTHSSVQSSSLCIGELGRSKSNPQSFNSGNKKKQIEQSEKNSLSLSSMIREGDIPFATRDILPDKSYVEFANKSSIERSTLPDFDSNSSLNYNVYMVSKFEHESHGSESNNKKLQNEKNEEYFRVEDKPLNGNNSQSNPNYLQTKTVKSNISNNNIWNGSNVENFMVIPVKSPEEIIGLSSAPTQTISSRKTNSSLKKINSIYPYGKIGIEPSSAPSQQQHFQINLLATQNGQNVIGESEFGDDNLQELNSINSKIPNLENATNTNQPSLNNLNNLNTKKGNTLPQQQLYHIQKQLIQYQQLVQVKNSKLTPTGINPSLINLLQTEPQPCEPHIYHQSTNTIGKMNNLNCHSNMNNHGEYFQHQNHQQQKHIFTQKQRSFFLQNQNCSSLEYNSQISKYNTIQNRSRDSINVQQLNQMNIAPVMNLHVGSPEKNGVERKRKSNSSWRKKPKHKPV